MRTTAESRPAWAAGFFAGVIGGLVMILVQSIARLGAGVPMFPDLFEDLATRTIPAALFSKVLDTFLFQAKPLLFVGLLVFQLIVLGVVGVVFTRVWGRRITSDRSDEGWRSGVIAGLAAWAITVVVLLPIAGQGMFGSATADGALGLNLVLIFGFLIFGLTLATSYQLLAVVPAPAASKAGVVDYAHVQSPDRRRMIGGVAVATVAVLTAGTTFRIVNPAKPNENASTAAAGSDVAAAPTASVNVAASAPTATEAAAAAPVASAPTTPASAASSLASAATTSAPPPPIASVLSAEWAIKELASEVTSTADFYAVSKNFFSDPTVDANQWTLQVMGEVSSPYTLTYNKLLQLPAIERYQTLCCISNEVGGDLISNALWRGTALRDIIMAAQPKAGVVKVVFTASDGYQDSVTYDRALLPQNVLAHTMNGESLNSKHGMPARLLIPGIYGMKNVKWITKIELMNIDFQGYWQTRGWSDLATINTMSRIDTQSVVNAKIPVGKTEIAGVAFGGEYGISKVEVSIDAGKTWRDAILKEPLGTFTWRLWRYDWDAKTGDYVIIVRATNGKGELQPSQLTDTLPNGATGWHSNSVSVG